MKKRILQLTLVITVIVSLFIPQVQAFAISAMSVFRVDSARTITITMMDIEEMMAYLEEHQDLFQQLRDNHLGEHGDLTEKEHAAREHFERDMSQYLLTDISEFNAFPVQLPQALSDETPVFSASDASITELTLDVEGINTLLAQMHGVPLFDESLNETIVEVHTPAVLVAQYEDSEMLLVATQMMHIEASANVKESLRTTLLTMPFISANLRGQLAAIPIDSRDIYLPVIAGFGREVSIGNYIGYIYASGDLSMLVDQMGDGLLTHDVANDASVLVWVQDGVIYILAGSNTDNELIDIARSMRLWS